MTIPEYEELIAFLRQQIADLTTERDRLKAESENATQALILSNEANIEMSDENADMLDALMELGLEEDETDVD